MNRILLLAIIIVVFTLLSCIPDGVQEANNAVATRNAKSDCLLQHGSCK